MLCTYFFLVVFLNICIQGGSSSAPAMDDFMRLNANFSGGGVVEVKPHQHANADFIGGGDNWNPLLEDDYSPSAHKRSSNVDLQGSFPF